MTEKKLFDKIARGERLEPAEQLMLDQILEIQSADGPGLWVSSLQDPQPSMAWRSQLNSKLLEIAPPTKARFAFGGRRPAFVWLGAGLGLASLSFVAVLALGSISRPGAGQAGIPQDAVAEVTPDVEPDLAMVLVSSHQADDAQVSMGVQAPRRTIESGFDWSKVEGRRRQR